MARSTVSPQEDGIHLTSEHDDLLLKISHYFTTIDQVKALAIHLFRGSPTGGAAIVDQSPKTNTFVTMAYDVLDKWRTQYYDKARGRPLYEVLKKREVNPRAAAECKSELCLENPGQKHLATRLVTGHTTAVGNYEKKFDDVGSVERTVVVYGDTGESGGKHNRFLLEVNGTVFEQNALREIARSFAGQFSLRFNEPRPKVEIELFDDSNYCEQQMAILSVNNTSLGELDVGRVEKRLKEILMTVLSRMQPIIEENQIVIKLYNDNSVAVLITMPTAAVRELLTILREDRQILEEHLLQVFGSHTSFTLASVFGSKDWPLVEELLAADSTTASLVDSASPFQIMRPLHTTPRDLPTNMADLVPLPSPGGGTTEHQEGSVNAGIQVTGQMNSELHKQQVTAVRPTVPTNERGVHLVPDHPLLLFVGLEFKTEGLLSNLAGILLKGLESDGKAFVDTLPSANCIWRKSTDVLKEWVVKKPEEAFGSTLFSILEGILGNPKAELKQRLLASESTQTRTVCSEQRQQCGQ